MVQAGEVIAKVKVIPDMQQLSAAQARVRLANVNANQAKIDYDRVKTLFDKGYISADEHDKVAQNYRQAREELTAANGQLQVIRDGVSRTNASASSTLIRSTITGLILDVPVKVGNSVILSNTFNDGTTIASVANMGDLIFRGNIDETEVGRLVTGMPMKITIGALEDQGLEARLEYVSPKAVESNGANQFEIKAAIHFDGKTAFRQIRSGYSATAEIVLAEARKVLTVPESAVEFSGDSAFVYVIQNAGGSEPSYDRKTIKTGLSDGISIEIKGGIATTDRVRGPQKMKDEEK
jgi:HlyD family secretion protein